MAKGEGTRSDEQSVDLDQYAKDAIDEVFSKEQQSYDEFVQGFMFLTKDDVTGMTAQSSHSCHGDSITQNGITSHDMNLKASDDVTHQNSLSQKSKETENDNVPEEVLGPGSTAVPILMRTAESSSGAVLQVDNFVDCEDEVSDDNDDDGEEEDKKKLQSFLEDDFLSSNYSPSVLTISNSSKNQEVEESNTKDLGRKVDLDDESLKAAKELEICYLSADVSTLPGEVDDHETAEQKDNSCACEAVISPNIRQLQISTRINKCNKKNNNLSEEDVGSDEVQPFTLDTDFDYDDVALTPKFSFVPKYMS